ncbi:hypothetical protein GCM10010434_042240 [Winogradskya humida]
MRAGDSVLELSMPNSLAVTMPRADLAAAGEPSIPRGIEADPGHSCGLPMKSESPGSESYRAINGGGEGI